MSEAARIRPRTEWPSPGSAFPVVALAASAGGLAALSQLLSGLSAGFGAPILIVQHLDPTHPSLLAAILARRTALTVKQAEQGDALEPGTVYLAPPNHHLIVQADHTLGLSSAASVRFLRPSADVLFASVASAFAARAIAVVLTGNGSDGSEGIKAIKKMGGKAIAQDQASSEFFGMPGAAVRTGVVDFVLPLTEIADRLTALVPTASAA